MYILTNDEMRRVDQATIDQWEIPSQVLMESAGLAVVEALGAKNDLQGKRVLILAGPGNNGGDGLVIARHLHMRGSHVTVMVLDESGKKSSDHAANRRILNHMPVRVFDLARLQQLKSLKAALNHSDVVIDALFGTGLSRKLSEFYIEALHMVNDQEAVFRVAVDSPSGLGGDQGRIYGAAFKADQTYALAYAKRGHLAPGASHYLGELEVLNIGIPKEAAALIKPQMRAVDVKDLAKALPKRSPEGHKYSFGRLGVIAGSLGTSGACVLTSKAAMRSGCGAVQVLTDKSIFSPVASPMPEVMVRPLAWPNETAVKWLVEKSDALVLGPGMGTSDEKEQVLAEVLKLYEGPLLLDADALTLLAKQPMELLTTTRASVLLTPHPGEMARLTGKSVQELQKDRPGYAAEYAQKWGVSILLKGPRSLIASPEGKLYVNLCDSPALATAGSGDVLSGIIGSLLAQGLEISEAARIGAVLHGASGQRAAKERGIHATVAGDLIDCLGAVFKEVERDHG